MLPQKTCFESLLLFVSPFCVCVWNGIPFFPITFPPIIMQVGNGFPLGLFPFRIGSFSTSMIMRRKGKMAINVFCIASICHYPEAQIISGNFRQQLPQERTCNFPVTQNLLHLNTKEIAQIMSTQVDKACMRWSIWFASIGIHTRLNHFWSWKPLYQFRWLKMVKAAVSGKIMWESFFFYIKLMDFGHKPAE